MSKGFYIMIEGGEGSGKDTQANLLEEYLGDLGCSVVRTREPGGTPEAEQIRNVLSKKDNDFDPLSELFLFEAARLENYRKVVQPSLERGYSVLKARGWPSTIAYQGFAGGVDLELIQELNKRATLGILPDLLFIIDVDPRVGLDREVGKDRFSMKGIEYHHKVRQGYLYVAKMLPPEKVSVIPYEDGIANMQKAIRRELGDRLGIGST